ncbi:hypothetical protein MKEN_01378200 [Mycena kentingensis (nom. inval.)]|nr:hypothetical protein MKEN_01378200 [Mycena kentingensis (nom. inval.)]
MKSPRAPASPFELQQTVLTYVASAQRYSTPVVPGDIWAQRDDNEPLGQRKASGNKTMARLMSSLLKQLYPSGPSYLLNRAFRILVSKKTQHAILVNMGISDKWFHKADKDAFEVALQTVASYDETVAEDWVAHIFTNIIHLLVKGRPEPGCENINTVKTPPSSTLVAHSLALLDTTNALQNLHTSSSPSFDISECAEPAFAHPACYAIIPDPPYDPVFPLLDLQPAIRWTYPPWMLASPEKRQQGRRGYREGDGPWDQEFGEKRWSRGGGYGGSYGQLVGGMNSGD